MKGVRVDGEKVVMGLTSESTAGRGDEMVANKTIKTNDLGVSTEVMSLTL
jgi:hypothetical protein